MHFGTVAQKVTKRLHLSDSNPQSLRRSSAKRLHLSDSNPQSLAKRLHSTDSPYLLSDLLGHRILVLSRLCGLARLFELPVVSQHFIENKCS